MRGWVQFLHSEDDVELKNAEDSIDAKFNGLLGGIESKVYTYENGWKAVYGIYGSYVSSTQEFGDTEIDQTGEYYGLNAAFRKGNVFSNLTLTRGFIENEAKTEWGTDKFDTTLVSVSGKAGIDLHKPSLTLTPAIYVAYTQVDTEDYTNKAGIEIENELTHVVTIAPELKLTKNFEEGLNGYAKVSYKTFMYSNNEVKADGVLLPEMSVKPYMEYSVGAEWVEKDNTTLYGEVSRHTGGREGWNVNLGLKLDF
jgi:outer membrane autotransporter protein